MDALGNLGKHLKILLLPSLNIHITGAAVFLKRIVPLVDISGIIDTPYTDKTLRCSRINDFICSQENPWLVFFCGNTKKRQCYLGHFMNDPGHQSGIERTVPPHSNLQPSRYVREMNQLKNTIVTPMACVVTIKRDEASFTHEFRLQKFSDEERKYFEY